MLGIQTVERAVEPAVLDDGMLLDAYAAELDACRKTKETYTRALRQWRRWLDHRGLGLLDTTRADVIAYRDELEGAGRSAATTNAYLTAIRSMYSWLESRGVYPNVAADVKGRRRNQRSPKDALTRAQAADLLDGEPETLEELRDRAMVNLMLRRGLRTVEVVRADVGDLRQVNGTAVLYVQGKGYAEKGDFIVLGDACLRSIYAYLDKRGPVEDDAPLFVGVGNRNKGGRLTTRTVSRTVKTAMEKAGISSAHLTAHSLRHTAVTFALLGGATVQEVQAMARHANLNTTMIYAHNLSKIEARAERSIDAYLQGGEHKPNTD